ncbi:MAG: dienelactone hydrolase family protein [Myxococcota bacterium]
MATARLSYSEGGVDFEGHLQLPGGDDPRPLVIVAHAWFGQTDFEREQAHRLTGLGYAGFALDVYGKGILGETPEECRALMEPLVQDRPALMRRVRAGLDAVKAHPRVDQSRVAAIGYCFGGLTVLDMAREGLELQGVCSIHGLLSPRPTMNQEIKAKVLALHGYEDRMAPPEAMLTFAEEMTNAGADWQIHAFGHTQHAFTLPSANSPELGVQYSKVASKRAYQTMDAFLAEVLT